MIQSNLKVENWFRRAQCPTTFLSLVIFMSSAAAAQTKPSSPTNSHPEADYKFVHLRLVPAQVEFSNPREYRKILVLGKTQGGGEIDLTHGAKLAPLAECVKADESGYLYPAKECDTKVVVSAAGLKVELPVTVRDFNQPHPVTFVRDVEPILNKVGCTAGTCHGAAKGKNGFKLSLRGYDPEFDYDALLYDLSGRRFNRADPGRSLMLAKPSQEVAHGGGRRFAKDSGYYRTIYNWIAQGVPFGDPATDAVTDLRVEPKEIFMTKPGESASLRIVARYQDGQTRDVTREATIESNVPDLASVDSDKASVHGERIGEATLLVRYQGKF